MFKQLSRFFAATVMILSLLNVSANAAVIDDSDPYKMVQEVANITFDRIKREQPQIKENPEVLRQIMKEELLPYVDYKFSAYKVLGKYVTSAPKEKLQEFVGVFREYLVTTYAIAMGYYDNQTVEFEPASSIEDERNVTVRAVVKDTVRPDIKIAFKVRKDRKTEQWKAYDMVAEGISMLSSKQSEFESILRQQGIQVVIDMMREKIEQPIAVEKPEEKAV